MADSSKIPFNTIKARLVQCLSTNETALLAIHDFGDWLESIDFEKLTLEQGTELERICGGVTCYSWYKDGNKDNIDKAVRSTGSNTTPVNGKRQHHIDFSSKGIRQHFSSRFKNNSENELP